MTYTAEQIDAMFATTDQAASQQLAQTLAHATKHTMGGYDRAFLALIEDDEIGQGRSDR